MFTKYQKFDVWKYFHEKNIGCFNWLGEELDIENRAKENFTTVLKSKYISVYLYGSQKNGFCNKSFQTTRLGIPPVRKDRRFCQTFLYNLCDILWQSQGSPLFMTQRHLTSKWPWIIRKSAATKSASFVQITSGTASGSVERPNSNRYPSVGILSFKMCVATMNKVLTHQSPPHFVDETNDSKNRK